MIQIFHISDLHVGKLLPLGRKDMIGALLDAVEAAMNNVPPEVKPFLLVTGDIIDFRLFSHKREYDDATTLLERFAGRIFIVPGNHDYGHKGNAFRSAAADRFETFAQDLKVPPPLEYSAGYTYRSKHPHVAVLDDGEGTKVLMVGLNSCKEMGWEDFAKGKVGKEQRAELRQALESPDYADCWKVVYLHHRLYNVEMAPAMELEDEAAVKAILEPRVNVIAYGHQGKEEDDEDAAVRPQADSKPIVTQVYRGPECNEIICSNGNRSVTDQTYNLITFDGPHAQGGKPAALPLAV